LETGGGHRYGIVCALDTGPLMRVVQVPLVASAGLNPLFLQVTAASLRAAITFLWAGHVQ
jgi:hypothetical protein